MNLKEKVKENRKTIQVIVITTTIVGLSAAVISTRYQLGASRSLMLKMINAGKEAGLDFNFVPMFTQTPK